MKVNVVITLTIYIDDLEKDQAIADLKQMDDPDLWAIAEKAHYDYVVVEE